MVKLYWIVYTTRHCWPLKKSKTPPFKRKRILFCQAQELKKFKKPPLVFCWPDKFESLHNYIKGLSHFQTENLSWGTLRTPLGRNGLIGWVIRTSVLHNAKIGKDLMHGMTVSSFRTFKFAFGDNSSSERDPEGP